MRSRQSVETRLRWGGARPPPQSRARHWVRGALDHRLRPASWRVPGRTQTLFFPISLPPSTQLPRGYADGPPDAPEYRIHVAHPIDHLDPHPLLAVVIEHRVRELVILVHTLGDRFAGVIGATLDRGTMQDTIDQIGLRHVQGAHAGHPVAFSSQHLVQCARLLERAGEP